MAGLPYVDSFWATKKRQIPFIVGNVTIIWETSYGMTLRNPGQLQSDEIRRAVDEAIERAFAEDLDTFTNNKTVRSLIEHAGMYVDLDSEEEPNPPVELSVSLEGTESTPVVTAVVVEGEKEIIHMSVDDLVKKGFLTKGVKGVGGE